MCYGVLHDTLFVNRALYKVYQLTERLTRLALIRAEEAILEVN